MKTRFDIKKITTQFAILGENQTYRSRRGERKEYERKGKKVISRITQQESPR